MENSIKILLENTEMDQYINKGKCIIEIFDYIKCSICNNIYFECYINEKLFLCIPHGIHNCVNCGENNNLQICEKCCKT